MAAIKQSTYINTKSVGIRKEVIPNRDLGALFFTDNILVPFGNPLTFENYNTACLYFGSDADEARLAKLYFDYTEANTDKQTYISFARYKEGYVTSHSLCIKDPKYTYKYSVYNIFESTAQWIPENGEALTVTGKEAVELTLLLWQEKGWLPLHEGDILGYKSDKQHGYITYKAVVKSKPEELVPIIKKDVKGRDYTTYEKIPAQYEVVDVYRLSSHSLRGTVETVEDLEPLRAVSNFGDTFKVKDKEYLEYTFDGVTWYQCIHIENQYSYVNEGRVIGSTEVGDLYSFNAINSRMGREHLILQQRLEHNISVTYRGDCATLDTLYSIEDATIGDMYFVVQNNKYYAYSNEDWIELEEYVQDMTMPIIPASEFESSSSSGEDDGDSGSQSDSDILGGDGGVFPEEEDFVSTYNPDETGIGYYYTNEQTRIRTVYKNVFASYEEVAAALQESITKHSSLASVRVKWIDETPDENSPVVGHFEVYSEDSVGVVGFPYDSDDNLCKVFGFYGGSTYQKNYKKFVCENPAEAVNRVSGNWNNFGSFAFINTPSNYPEVAAWNITQNYKYLYSVAVENTDNEKHLGTVKTLTSGYNRYETVIPMAILAATNFEDVDSIKNFMFQKIEGLEPTVTTDSEKVVYDKANINYIGRTQEHGTIRDFYQRGVCSDGSDLSVYCAEIWLQDNLTTALLNLLLQNEKVSPNIQSLGLASSVMIPCLQKALGNGMIQVPVVLDDVTKIYIDQITGQEGSWEEILKDGFALSLNIVDDANHGGKAISYTLIYHKAGVIRYINGLHAFREQ